MKTACATPDSCACELRAAQEFEASTTIRRHGAPSSTPIPVVPSMKSEVAAADQNQEQGGASTDLHLVCGFRIPPVFADRIDMLGLIKLGEISALVSQSASNVCACSHAPRRFYLCALR